MSSNKANGVTSPTKVKELAGIFQSLEPPSPSKKVDPAISRRAFAVGKTTIVIQDKDSKVIPAQAKPGSKVGEISQNYHKPNQVLLSPNPKFAYATPPLPKSPSPMTATATSTPPLPKSPSPIAVQVRPQQSVVNGNGGLRRPSVRISSWDAKQAEELQNTESVKARAARMNSQPDGNANKPVTPTPGKLNASAFFPTSSTGSTQKSMDTPAFQSNGYEPKASEEYVQKEEVYDYQEDKHDQQEDKYDAQEEEYNHQEDNYDQQEDNRSNEMSHEADEETNNGYQSSYRNEEQEEDHERQEEEDHDVEEQHPEDRGYREDAYEEQDSKEDTSSYNAETELVHEEDGGHNEERQMDHDRESTKAEEEYQEETRANGEEDEGNLYDAGNADNGSNNGEDTNEHNE